jgi:hypothetical protein
MDKRKILIQIDSDLQPSVFDRVVAVDSGADEIFSYGGVTPEQVRTLVHGAIFTRGPKDLKSTALFIGGSDVAAGERLLSEAMKHMIPAFGLRVSVLFDANGANTTAAATVRAVARHLDLRSVRALILGGTGPLGQRIARLLARQQADIRIGSRQRPRSAAVCETIRAKVPDARVEPVLASTADEVRAVLDDRTLVINAATAGVMLLPRSVRTTCPGLRMAIDLNAVPPLGIEGVEVVDRGVEREGMICYGAIGVGDTKMKVHKASVARLFERNDQLLDAEEVYALAQAF